MLTLHRALLQTIADKGSRLREVRKDLLRQRPEQTQRWFHGPDGCDLFLWYDARKDLAHVQLTFERRVVEWSPEERLRTGRLVAFDPLRPLDDRGKIELDSRPDPQTLELARVLLESASVDELTLMLVRNQLGLRAG